MWPTWLQKNVHNLVNFKARVKKFCRNIQQCVLIHLMHLMEKGPQLTQFFFPASSSILTSNPYNVNYYNSIPSLVKDLLEEMCKSLRSTLTANPLYNLNEFYNITWKWVLTFHIWRCYAYFVFTVWMVYLSIILSIYLSIDIYIYIYIYIYRVFNTTRISLFSRKLYGTGCWRKKIITKPYVKNRLVIFSFPRTSH